MGILIFILVVVLAWLLFSPKVYRESRERGPHLLVTTFANGTQERLDQETDFDIEEQVADRLCLPTVLTIEYHRGCDQAHRTWKPEEDDPQQVCLPPLQQRQQSDR